jgi:transcription factor IIIB subunit 2
MLLDLSDVTQVNVYELGRTYLKLSSSLHIKIPAVDPCIYIVRFAAKLDLGDKSHEIEMTAMRIAQRMKRDWMHFGRRPSGLCGSALLVAARLHDVHCDIKEVIKVVKVCEATIRKRLSEFGDTPTSRLTLEEFMQVDLEGEEDPPCFKAARLKKIKDEEGDEVTVDETGAVINKQVENTVSRLQEQIEEELEKIRKQRKANHPFAHFANFVEEGTISAEVATDVVDEALAQEFVLQETLAVVFSEGVEINAQDHVESNLLPTASTLKLTESPFKIPTGAPPFKRSVSKNEPNAVESVPKEEVVNSQEPMKDEGVLFVGDLDDDELDSYILSDHEATIKRSVWEEVNADWITGEQEKLRIKEEEEAEMRMKESRGELPTRKKRKVKKRLAIQASTAGEAIEKMLQEKRISNKINYDVLRQLDGTLTTDNADEKDGDIIEMRGRSDSVISRQSVTSDVIKTTPTTKRLPSIRNFVASHIRLPGSSVRSRSRASSITSSSYHRDRRDSVSSNVSVDPTPKESLNNDIATEIESTRQHQQTTSTFSNKRREDDEEIQREPQIVEDDDEELEEEEEDDEVQQSQLSIAQLMSQRMGGDIQEVEDEDIMTDHDDY